MIEVLSAHWQRSLQAVGVDPTLARTAFPAIVAAYSSRDRHYHTLTHIHQVLSTLETLHAPVHLFPAVHLAAWFHDAVYDPRAADNEEKSAAWAIDLLTSLAVPPATIAHIARLILCTQHHRPDPNDPDSQLLLDADLAILGAAPAQYRVYANAIRQEYAWVPIADYRQGRKQILETFLHRDRLYFTPLLNEQLETTARHNLTTEIDELNQGTAVTEEPRHPFSSP